MIGNKACGPCGTGPRDFPPLWWGFTDFPPVAPFYWDVYSAEERVKALCDYLWKTIHFAEGTAQDVADIEKQLADLLEEFEDFKEHGFDDYYRDQVAQWIAQNSKYLFDTLARQVYFGIGGRPTPASPGPTPRSPKMRGDRDDPDGIISVFIAMAVIIAVAWKTVR